MFGIGGGEFLLILVLALVVFGPKKLPGIAKSLGRGYAEFKRASQELREGISEDINISHFRSSIEEARRSLEEDIPPPTPPKRENVPESLPYGDYGPSVSFDVFKEDSHHKGSEEHRANDPANQPYLAHNPSSSGNGQDTAKNEPFGSPGKSAPNLQKSSEEKAEEDIRDNG